VKYRVFRISTYIERAGFFVALMAFLLYFVGYEFARHAGQLDGGRFAEYVDLLARLIVGGGIFSACGAFLQFAFFRELEPVVERAIRSLCANQT